MADDPSERREVQVGFTDAAEASVPIGIGTPLQVEVKGLAQHLRARAVGMIPGRCLVSTAPRLPAGRGPLRPGQELIVRYLYEGTVFAFPTTVVATVERPEPMVICEYPKVVARHRLRADERIACRLPGTLHLGEETVPVIVLDLSRGGARCLVRGRPAALGGADEPQDPAPPPSEPDAEADEAAEDPAAANPAAPARLEIPLPGTTDTLSVRCEIRKTDPVADGLAVGVHFDPEDVDAQGRLVDFLEALSPRDGGNG